MTHSTAVVSADSEIELHFNITLEDGSAADSTRVNGKPARLQLGQGIASAAFEQALVGMHVKQSKTFTLAPGEVMAMPHPDNIKEVPRSQFANQLSLEEGTIINFKLPNGQDLPGIVREFDEEHVIVDFNHPLAGHALTFTVEILSIL